MGGKAWSDREVEILRRYYSASGKGAPIDLAKLAKLLAPRARTNICRKARELGLTNQCRGKVAQPGLPMLGKRTQEELRAMQSAAAKRRIAVHGHPRGMLGKRHTAELKHRISEHHRRLWADPTSRHRSLSARQKRSDLRSALARIRPASACYSRCARGRRPDIGSDFFRSSWEANYARYLNTLVTSGEVISWSYEPRAFIFPGVGIGVRSYTPDFEVTFTDGRREWHEVKGWMDPKSILKLERMAKLFPEERVVIIGARWFKAAKRDGLAQKIAGWEK